MILQISNATTPANSPAYDGGSAYAVRVVSFSSGATIAFDTNQSKRTIFGYFAYRTRKRGGWGRIYLTGTVVIEIATDPDETFDGAGAAGVSSVDANGNTLVVGPTAAGAVATAAPVEVAGLDSASTVRPLPVNVATSAPAGTAVGSQWWGVAVSGIRSTDGNASEPFHTDSASRLIPGNDSKDFSVASPAAPGTTLGSQYNCIFAPRRVQFDLKVQGATGGTLDIYIQTSLDGGSSWIDVAHLTQIAAAAALIRDAVVLDADNGVPAAPLTGLNTADGTPTLTVNTTRNIVGNSWRVVFVAGAGTSAGATQTIKALFS